MKIKYLLSVILLSLLAITGCHDVDELVRTDGTNVNTLTIRGYLASSETTDYSTIIDEASAIVTVQIPYYISDTEAIQGDLTQMRLRASSLPIGSRFEPSLAGIHNLVEGYQSTLIGEDGAKKTYTFKAVYVKSSLAQITKIELTNYPRATVRIENPEEGSSTGKIIVYKTTSAMDAALKVADLSLTLSPWATSDLQAGTEIDLNSPYEITVTSQDGNTSTTYRTSIETPTLLPSGEVGYTSSLFGFQIYTDNTQGFEVGANRTMAIIDDYLIISNSNDYSKMIVLDRYNGQVITDVKVNTTGIDAGRSIHAITSDDAGHLVAMAYTSTLDDNTTDLNVRAWVWANGIENAPKSIVYANINGSAFANAPMGINGVTKLDIGRTITVKGDLTSGDAIIATAAKNVPRPVFLIFKDGVMQSPAYVEWSGGTVSMWNATKVVLTTNTKPLGYIWSTANFRQGVHYVPVGTDGSRAVSFTLPTSHWWLGSATYDKNVRGVDYIEFNGTCLLGVQNGQSSSSVWHHRLYVSNITTSPTASSMANGFIFDSREGSASGTAGIPGTGFAVTGMTSSASFESGKVVLGTNVDETGDVVFGKSSDGYAVQVYMLTTDQGIFAYEITKFDM